MNKIKAQRIKIHQKWGGHCAYCGKLIAYKDMQIDHVSPLAYAPSPDDKNSAVHSFENLMPSCRRCNHYKRQCDLEGFRRLIKTLHERLQDQYNIKVAIDYGIVVIKPFNGIFYFEKFQRSTIKTLISESLF